MRFSDCFSIQCSRLSKHIGSPGQPPCETAVAHPPRPWAATALLRLWEAVYGACEQVDSKGTVPHHQALPLRSSRYSSGELHPLGDGMANIPTHIYTHLHTAFTATSWCPDYHSCENAVQILLRLFYLPEAHLDTELHTVVLILQTPCSVVPSPGSGAPDFVVGT